MAVVKILHSETTGHVPDPTAMVPGQVAINSVDGIFYWTPDGVTLYQFALLNQVAVTQSPGDNSTKVATDAFVAAAVAALSSAIVDGAPSNLNTLLALAAAINNDPMFSVTINNSLLNRIRYDQAQSLNATQIGQVTANIGVFARTPVGDNNSTISAVTREINLTAALTAPRTWTLPAANTVSPGWIIFAIDEIGGAVSGTNTLTIATGTGTDTINGEAAGASFVINSRFRYLLIQCDGVSKWSVHQPGIQFDHVQSPTAAQAVQAITNLGIFARTAVGDANVTILNSTREINITAAFTAARAWSLPAANTVQPGWLIFAIDEHGGAVSSTNTLTLTPNGGDTINSQSSLVITAPFRALLLECDGSSKWVLHQSVPLNFSTTIGVGYSVSPYNAGTLSSGTFTPSAANGNYQYATNNGAHTLAAPTTDCAVDILYTNGSSAGAVTFSGFNVGSSPGSALTTITGNKFIISIRRINGVATYSVYALQ